MDFVAVLDNIRSLHNVGSIFRTADGAGVKKIYLCGITPAPVDAFGRPRQQIAKVSLGAEKSVEWEKVSSAARLLKKLKKDGYKILAVEQAKNSVLFYKIRGIRTCGEFHRTMRSQFGIALVVGNEVKGLSKSILKLADEILEIPMRDASVRQAHHPRHAGRGKESLNVSVAFGIVVYHLAVKRGERNKRRK